MVAAYRRSFFPPGQLAGHGVKLTSVRAGNVVGGGDWAKDRIITDVVRHLVAGKPVPVRNPRAVRPWQHVLEPLGGYLSLAARMFESDDPAWCDAWNFGPVPGEEIPVGQLVELFIRAWGGGSWQDVSDPARRTKRACCDCALIRPCMSLVGSRNGMSWRQSGGRPSGSAGFMQAPRRTRWPPAARISKPTRTCPLRPGEGQTAPRNRDEVANKLQPDRYFLCSIPSLFPEDLDHVLVHLQDDWEELRGQRLFLTGGTGFFGAWLTESFLWANQKLELGAEVVVLSRDSAAFLRKMPHLAEQSQRCRSMLETWLRSRFRRDVFRM